MLRHINRFRKKGVSTVELAILFALVAGIFTTLLTYGQRQLGRKVQQAFEWSAGNDGVPGGYVAAGFTQQETGSDMNMDEHTNESLNVGAADMTYVQGGGTNGTGVKTTTGTQ